jgi:hypothetical protein
MRGYAFVLAAIVAGCGGSSSTTVTPSSVPPSDNGGAGGGGNGGGGTTGGGGGGTTGGGGGGMPGGGGGGAGGTGGGGGSGGMGGGGGSGGGGGGGGSACTSTTPQAIATAQKGAYVLAVDDSNVYFMAEPEQTKENDWNLFRAPSSGGAAVEVGTTSDWTLPQITVNSTAVFTIAFDGQLMRWPKDGSAPTVMIDNFGDGYYGCLTDALGYLYMCDGDHDRYLIERRPEDGGAAIEMATLFGVQQLAFDATYVYMTSNDGGLYRMPNQADFHTPLELVGNAGTPLTAIAVDDTHVFVGDTNGDILVAGKQPGTSFSILAKTAAYPSKLRVDNGSVYSLAGELDDVGHHSVISRVSTDGKTGASLVDLHGIIGDMALRGDYVYYTLENDSTVYRVCK